MKIAIVFASQTGNTAAVAQAIREGCAGHEIVAFGPPPANVGEAELVFAGSWTDKGTCAPELGEFLRALHGRRVVLFGTAGFGLSESYFASLGDRFKGEIPADNRVVDAWFCPGRMPPEVRERYEAQLKERPGDKRLENMLQAYDHALTHPDGADLEHARAFARTMVEKVEGSICFVN